MSIHAKSALAGQKWSKNLRVELQDGKISRLFADVPPEPQDTRVDVLLPGIANLHSHSFQRAMAGMTEVRAAGRESFWSWRDLMYRFLDHLTPEQMQAIAALVFMEMQEAGYTSVGEFHYVHHQPGGQPYDTLSELSQRIFAAAAQTGIGLTHLPVLYRYGGVDQNALAGGQLRFGNDLESYYELVQACREIQSNTDTQVGVAPHSLRATARTDLSALLNFAPNGPVHIHIAEQLQEVAEVEEARGQRPVAWLLDKFDVNRRWCLIHATHMTPTETLALAQSEAVAGLCPITEANLGDGIFNGTDYLHAGGSIGIGSDSNVRISLPEEMRMLEYSQRLRDHARAVLVNGEGSAGHSLYTQAAAGGAQALARDAGEIAVGKLADLMALDRTHPTLCALRDEQVLDGLCFAAPDGLVTDVWSAGRHMVQQGRHIQRDGIVASYRAAIADLLTDL